MGTSLRELHTRGNFLSLIFYLLFIKARQFFISYFLSLIFHHEAIFYFLSFIFYFNI